MSPDALHLHQLSNTERYIIAKNKVKQEHTIIDCKISPLKGVNGYLGQYFHVEMMIKEKQGEPEKHRFFMKTMMAEGWQIQFLTNDGVFDKEVNFYKDVSGPFRKYISTDVYPECFLAVTGKMVLSDATLQGYRPLKDIVEPFDYEHAKVGMIALARLHVASLIYEEKTGRKVGEDFPDAAREVTYKPGSLGLDFLRSGGDAVAALAPHLTTELGDNPEAVALLQRHVKLWMEKLDFYLNEDSQHQRVICHGDAWPANFLFKYDEEKPTSAMLVDFQMTRLRSPAVDVNTFMYVSVPGDTLKEWRESLLNVYYQVITEEMRNNGLDANAIYPKEEFLQAYIYYQIVGVIYGLLFFGFCRVQPHKLKEATSTKEKAWHYYYVDRRQEIIDFYKESPILQRFFNGITDELYYNFIQSNRGLTQLTS